MINQKKAVMLINLGSPDSPSVSDVRKYLDEFLMDEDVIDLPYFLRAIVVKGFILPFRPQKSAEAYQSVWWKEGSPLIVISKNVQKKLQEKVNFPVALAMRYGNPSIKSTFQNLLQQHPDLKEILIIPLYPHYAKSSTKTALSQANRVRKIIAPQVHISSIQSFFDEPNYIEALSSSIQPFLKENFDYYLFSYHGLPERHIRKTDITKNHCLKVENCCKTKSPAHEFCYRHQTLITTQKVTAQLGILAHQFGLSFQSRLGQDAWLKPFTEPELERLARSGVKKLAVICPAFVSDCLETIEEIGIRGKAIFRKAGGQDLTLIPCLNENDAWINTLKIFTEKHLGFA